jgi:4-hydroxybenzoate polyprenyltransferase
VARGLKTLAHIFGDIKLAHTVFALPYALISAHIAFDGNYEWTKLLLILACMFFARSAAMSFNRYIDADIDKANPRTQERSIPSGKVNRTHMLIFTIVCSVAFVICAYLLNFLCFLLSFPALFVILVYSYSKRFTLSTHAWLGLALGIAPVGAWIAIRGGFDIGPIILSLAVIAWVAGFDIIYALQDMDFDREKGMKSIPARFGPAGSLNLARLFHTGTLAMLAAFGIYIGLGIAYWIGFGIIFILLLVEHGLVKPTDFSKVGYAFFTVNGAVSFLLLISVIIDRPQFISGG